MIRATEICLDLSIALQLGLRFDELRNQLQMNRRYGQAAAYLRKNPLFGS